MLGSDMEWMIVDSEELWLAVEEGTSRSRVWALAEDGMEGAGWRGRRGSVSSGESCWHMYRPIERFPESGRGKVPIPLSNVLIWQFDSITWLWSAVSATLSSSSSRTSSSTSSPCLEVLS